MWYVRPSAKIHEITHSVHACESFFWNFCANQMSLERVVCKYVKGLFLRNDQSFESMFCLNNSFDSGLDVFVVRVEDDSAFFVGKKIVEEALLCRRANC